MKSNGYTKPFLPAKTTYKGFKGSALFSAPSFFILFRSKRVKPRTFKSTLQMTKNYSGCICPKKK